MPASYNGTTLQFDADLLQDKDRTSWMQVVKSTLNRIAASRTGRAVLNEICSGAKTVKIVPFYRSEKNASAMPRNYNDAYYKDRPVRSGGDGHADPNWGAGTGRGSDVRVEFTPWRWAAFHRPVILLHELVHAAEMQRGVLFNNVVSTARFDTVAEFDAIVTENIYRSELGIFLRKDHDGFQRLVGDKLLPTAAEMKARLISFRARMAHLTEALSHIDVPFNPLRPGARGAP